jgi:aminodeoxyfutalosine synthase
MTLTATPASPTYLPLPDELEALRTQLDCGGHVSAEQAHGLWSRATPLELGLLADLVARRKWEGTVHLSHPLRLPLHGICQGPCTVCSAQGIRVDRGEAVSASVLLHAVAAAQPDELHLIALEAALSQTLDDLLGLLRSLRAQHPHLWIAALTPVQVVSLAEQAALEVHEVLTNLQAAGLDSLLAPHEEIYTAQGPRVVADGGLEPAVVADLQAAAHRCGLATVLSLYYGPEPEGARVVSSLLQMRAAQQQTAGSSVVALVPAVPARSSSLEQAPGGYEDLRMTAMARLLLDNVPHVRVPWMAQGLKMGQVALSFGGDDLGWAPLDPHVRAYAHPATFLAVSVQALRRLTLGSGHRLVGVDGAYRPCDLTPWETAAEAPATSAAADLSAVPSAPEDPADELGCGAGAADACGA